MNSCTFQNDFSVSPKKIHMPLKPHIFNKLFFHKDVSSLSDEHLSSPLVEDINLSLRRKYCSIQEAKNIEGQRGDTLCCQDAH